MINSLKRVGIEGIYIDIVNVVCGKTTASIMLNEENLKAFQWYPLYPTDAAIEVS